MLEDLIGVLIVGAIVVAIVLGVRGWNDGSLAGWAYDALPLEVADLVAGRAVGADAARTDALALLSPDEPGAEPTPGSPGQAIVEVVTDLAETLPGELEQQAAAALDETLPAVPVPSISGLGGAGEVSTVPLPGLADLAAPTATVEPTPEPTATPEPTSPQATAMASRYTAQVFLPLCAWVRASTLGSILIEVVYPTHEHDLFVVWPDRVEKRPDRGWTGYHLTSAPAFYVRYTGTVHQVYQYGDPMALSRIARTIEQFAPAAVEQRQADSGAGGKSIAGRKGAAQ